jgi:hypothetical protein
VSRNAKRNVSIKPIGIFDWRRPVGMAIFAVISRRYGVIRVASAARFHANFVAATFRSAS